MRVLMFKLKMWWQALWAKTPKFRVTEVNGDVFVIPESFKGSSIYMKLKAGKVYEPHTIEAFREFYRGGNIVEAGAYIGDMLPMLSFFAGFRGDNRVYAFEPIELQHRLCHANIILNNLENVDLINLGLSNTTEKMWFSSTGEQHGQTARVVMEGDQGDVFLNCTTLDEFEIPNVGLIHLDIEGQELNALYGARKTIIRDRPVIIVEANFLDDLDYEKFFIDLNYKKIKRVHNNLIYVPLNEKE